MQWLCCLVGSQCPPSTPPLLELQTFSSLFDFPFSVSVSVPPVPCALRAALLSPLEFAPTLVFSSHSTLQKATLYHTLPLQRVSACNSAYVYSIYLFRHLPRPREEEIGIGWCRKKKPRGLASSPQKKNRPCSSSSSYKRIAHIERNTYLSRARRYRHILYIFV